jgi:hypothetical protein
MEEELSNIKTSRESQSSPTVKIPVEVIPVYNSYAHISKELNLLEKLMLSCLNSQDGHLHRRFNIQYNLCISSLYL